MEEKVRLADIAKELGLSTATISYVLHGKTNMVSEKTAIRVRRALEERGYLPRAAEILLAQNPAKIVGVVLHAHKKYEEHVFEDAFISSTLNALSLECARRGLQMMVQPVESLEEIIPFSTMWNLEGLVLIGFCKADYSHLRENVRLPFVIYDACGITTERVCAINIDDWKGGFLMGDYFRQGGHKQALCLADNEAGMDLQRWKGFSQGFGPGARFMCIPQSREKRMAFYQEKLSEIKSYSALFVLSDTYAVELLHFLQSHGIPIPDEISIAGFDDSPLCKLVTPALTSIRQDVKERARAALDALQKLHCGQVEPAITLSTSLVIRESTRSLQVR